MGRDTSAPGTMVQGATLKNAVGGQKAYTASDIVTCPIRPRGDDGEDTKGRPRLFTTQQVRSRSIACCKKNSTFKTNIRPKINLNI